MAAKVATKEVKAKPAPTPVPAPVNGMHSLVLYSLYAPTWTAYKKDQRITREVKEMNHVDDAVDAGSFNKLLLPDCASLSKLKSYIGAVRGSWFYGRTAPWGEQRGARVGKAEDVMETMAEFGDKQEGLEPLKLAFAGEYEAMIAKAEFTLNEMFNPEDYPPLDRVLEKFQLRLSVSPLPNVNDVRVMKEIPEHVRADIERALKAEFDKAYNATAKDAFERLLKPVAHMATTLRAYDKGEVKKLYDSVVENVRDIANMMHTLNITRNPDLDRMADETFALVADMKAADLKESEGHLRTTAQKAEDLAARIAKFIP